MKELIMAENKHINDIVTLRVEMQIEDWNHTLHKDFSPYSSEFAVITEKHIRERLNNSLYFAVMYLDKIPIALCGIEELCELPQITVCTEKSGRHGCIVSVYTKQQYRGKGHQQQLLKYLLSNAKNEGFNDITLTTNTPDAIHIYEKIGFKQISNKYFLSL